MKFGLGIVVAAVAVVAGYLAMTRVNEDHTEVATSAQPAQVEETTVATPTVEEQLETNAEEETAASVTEQTVEATQNAVEQAQEAVEAAADIATEAAQETVEAASDAVQEVASDVAEAVEGAVDSAADMGEAVTEAVTENTFVETATETGSAMADKTIDAAKGAAEWFTVEGFDFDKASAFIAELELNALAQVALTKGLETARDNPELLSVALEKARMQLGL